MKKGQIFSANSHKGRAIITKANDEEVEIKWFIGSNGTPMPYESQIKRAHPIKVLQKEIDSGNLILNNPDNPNWLFLIRKSNVHS